MHLEIFALCDAATVSGGKLNILGAFDSIHSSKMPGAHSQCALALRIRFSRLEEGEHRVKINFVDEDGQPVMSGLDGVIKVRFNTDDDSAVTNFIINMHQLKLTRYGVYSFDIAIDGYHKASLPLLVKEAKNQ